MNQDEIKMKIQEDYHKVCGAIQEILFRGRNNGAILKPDYVTPTVDSRRNFPFDSSEGELSYYFSLRGILERAAAGQLISKDSVLCRKLPKYVSDLVR